MNAKRLAKPALLLRLAAGAVMAVALVQPALAQGELSVAREGGKVSASAALHFRIVIRENVRFDSKSLGFEQQARAPHMPQVQRHVASDDGLQRVTLAAP